MQPRCIPCKWAWCSWWLEDGQCGGVRHWSWDGIMLNKYPCFVGFDGNQWYPQMSSKKPIGYQNMVSVAKKQIHQQMSCNKCNAGSLGIVAGTQQMDGTWKHLKKWRPPSMLHKKSKTCTKKIHLGLQLDMASQRYLIADCGFCFATSALAPLASRRGKNWKSECRP